MVCVKALITYRRSRALIDNLMLIRHPRLTACGMTVKGSRSKPLFSASLVIQCGENGEAIAFFVIIPYAPTEPTSMKY